MNTHLAKAGVPFIVFVGCANNCTMDDAIVAQYDAIVVQ